MNPATVHYLNVFLGAGAIALQIIFTVALFLLFFGPRKNIFLDYINKHFLILGFLISLSASLFSLVYSEIIGFLSCYQQLVSEFGGYISIPMLALTTFFSLLVILAVAHFYNSRTSNT